MNVCFVNPLSSHFIWNPSSTIKAALWCILTHTGCKMSWGLKGRQKYMIHVLSSPASAAWHCQLTDWRTWQQFCPIVMPGTVRFAPGCKTSTNSRCQRNASADATTSKEQSWPSGLRAAGASGPVSTEYTTAGLLPRHATWRGVANWIHGRTPAGSARMTSDEVVGSPSSPSAYRAQCFLSLPTEVMLPKWGKA